jgi:hypothetical protein
MKRAILCLLLLGLLLVAGISNAAAPKAGSAPVITVQPIARDVTAGAPLALSIAVDGALPLRCQWYRDGVAITNSSRVSGATGMVVSLSATPVTFVLNIDPALTNDAGGYYAVVVSSGNATTSRVASVNVSRLVASTALTGATGLVARIPGQVGEVYRAELQENFGPWLTNAYATNIQGEGIAVMRWSSASVFRQVRFAVDHTLPVLYTHRGAARPFSAYGKLNQVWRWEGSTDFTQWTDLGLVTNRTGWLHFRDDPFIPSQHRFYRLAPE